MALDRSQPPPSDEARGVRFPPFERRQLGNGLTVVLCRQTAVPLVSLQHIGTAGSAFDADLPGLSVMATSLLDDGTRHRSATQIADEIEQRGGSIGASCGWDSSHLSVGLLRRDLDFGVTLLAECLLEPAFESGEIERLRGRTLAELARRRDLPDAWASNQFAEALWQPGPYAHPVLGTEASVPKIEREDIEKLAAAHRTTDASFLLAVGDFEPDELLSLLERDLGHIAQTSAPVPPAPEARPAGRRIVLVDRPGAQTSLRVGHASVAWSHPDRPALTLVNALFGGKFTSRINLNLRERHGFTYGAHSSFQYRRSGGVFVISTSVSNDVVGRSVEELLLELERVVDAPATAQEVDDARQYLLGVFPYGLQTIQGLAARLEDMEHRALPSDYYDTMKQRLDLTPQQLLEAAQRQIHPGDAVIVAVGPRDVLEPQLSPLGALDVVS